MKIDDFKIRLGQGVDRIKFGMSRADVKKILGNPDEIAEYEHSDNSKSETFYYDELGIDCTFESKDHYRLGSISVNSEEYHLAERLRVGLSKDEVLALIEEFQWETPHIEDASCPEFPNHELFEFAELNLHLWFDDRVVSSIQFGPERTDDRKVVWGEYL